MKTYDIDLSVDTLRALLWQYNDAETLEALIQKKQDWYNANQTEFWRAWVRDVFDLRTANDFGLAVWSIIIGCSDSIIEPQSNPNQPIFAFDREFNFDRGNFGSQSSRSTRLNTEQKRLFIRLRYFQMTSRCTVPEINRMLRAAFPNLRVFVGDTNMMDYIIYVFSGALSDDVKFLIDHFDILPRPAAIGEVKNIVTRKVFGFDEFNLNFDRGNFGK